MSMGILDRIDNGSCNSITIIVILISINITLNLTIADSDTIRKK